MAVSGLRSRVERLLRGDVREQDLHHLFFGMREEVSSPGLVREIGHFLAHPRMRTQGLATQEVRDLFAFLKFRVPIAASRLVSTALPATMPDALRANLRRMRKSTLKREARTNPTHAKRVLDRILARMQPTGFGGLTKPVMLSQEEYDVFSCVVTHTKGGPLFNEDDLFREFVRILRKNELLETSEAEAFEGCRVAVSLLALTAMHNRTIDLGDGAAASAAITPDMYGNLAIFCIRRRRAWQRGDAATYGGRMAVRYETPH